MNGPLTLTLTGPRFSANDRLHFRRRDQLVKHWRDLAQVPARAAVGASFRPLQMAHVVVTQVPHSRGRVDPGNVAPAADDERTASLAVAALAGASFADVAIFATAGNRRPEPAHAAFCLHCDSPTCKRDPNREAA